MNARWVPMTVMTMPPVPILLAALLVNVMKATRAAAPVARMWMNAAVWTTVMRTPLVPIPPVVLLAPATAVMTAQERAVPISTNAAAVRTTTAMRTPLAETPPVVLLVTVIAVTAAMVLPVLM